MTIGFIDNDIALKLMAFQLFDDAIALLNLTPDNLRVLATAKHRYRRQLQKHKEYPDERLKQAIALFEACQTTSEPTVEDLLRLDPFKDDIQVGEATLILAASATNDFVLLSGDKKCFAALPQIPAELYKHLCGRVVCLEQIIFKLIDVLMFESVRNRILPAMQYDKSIQLCFGYSKPAPEGQVRAALQSCISDIQRQAPGLLMDLS